MVFNDSIKKLNSRTNCKIVMLDNNKIRKDK